MSKSATKGLSSLRQQLHCTHAAMQWAPEHLVKIVVVTQVSIMTGSWLTGAQCKVCRYITWGYEHSHQVTEDAYL